MTSPSCSLCVRALCVLLDHLQGVVALTSAVLVGETDYCRPLSDGCACSGNDEAGEVV